MPFCTNCGSRLADGANFCQVCGARVAVAAVTTAQGIDAVYTGEGYAVMLVGSGQCSLIDAANLLSDTCGYTDAEAMALISNAPTLVAQNLTRQQAAYLAQTMTEYGLEAAVYDRSGNLTVTSDVDSVFDGSGSVLAGVAAILGLIDVGNRVAAANVRRWTLRTRPVVYVPPRPPRRPPVRRQMFRTVRPAPRAVPRVTVRPIPACPAPARPAHPSTLRPAPAPHPSTLRPARARPSAQRPAGPRPGGIKPGPGRGRP